MTTTRRKYARTRVLDDGAHFGKYRIVRLIARGGMSEVYEGIHTGLRKPVALKVLRSDLAENDEARERFLAEGSNAALVRHPSVVNVSDVGVIDDVPYLVMELLEGQSLGELYHVNAPLPPNELIDLLLPIASAIALAHDHGVIHRDLKPENVFLQYDGRRIVPKVLDFGAARLMTEPRITINLSVLGTPHYMSPEQARGDAAVDARTDQYALAVMLYEGLTGFLPRESEDALGLLHEAAAGSFRPPSDHVSLPDGLESVILRAMSREPSQRYASVRDFALALVPFASRAARDYWNVELTYPTTGASADIAMPPLSARILQERNTTPTIDSATDIPIADVKTIPPGSDPEPRAPDSSQEKKTLSLSTNKRRSKTVLAASLVAGLAAVGFIAVRAQLSGEPAAAQPAAATTSSIEVDVVVTPPTAELLLDGKSVGFGRFVGRLPRDGQLHELRVVAYGFDAQTVTFLDSAPPRQITLQRTPSAAPAEPPPRTARSVRVAHRVQAPAPRRSRERSEPRAAEVAPPVAPQPAPTATEVAAPRVRVINDSAPKVDVID